VSDLTTEMAWALGIFEGEGCIYITKAGYVNLKVSMTDPDVVVRFMDVVGCGNVAPHTYRGRPGHYKPLTRWRCSRGADVFNLLAHWGPHFSERRAAKVLDALTARGLIGGTST